MIIKMTARRAIQNSAEDLQKKVDEHMRLLYLAFAEGNVDGKVTVYCDSECFYRYRFRETIGKVIETLENTRRAFKSKQLEALRKELLMILMEENSCMERQTVDHR